MLNAEDVSNITVEQIIQYYKGKGFMPASTSTYNRMCKEQLLHMKEMLAVATYMRDKGFKIDPAQVQMWENSIAPLEKYISYLEKFGGSNNLNRAKEERALSNKD